MDFVSDALFNGRRLRALTVIDAYTREALAIEVDQGINGEQVVDAVTRVAATRGAPHTIRVDNGLEFISKALDRWRVAVYSLDRRRVPVAMNRRERRRRCEDRSTTRSAPRALSADD